MSEKVFEQAKPGTVIAENIAFEDFVLDT